jgi:hypothetical protein
MEGLTEQASMFTRHDVIRALHPHLAVFPASELEQLADALLASVRVVPVTGLDARCPHLPFDARQVQEHPTSRKANE